MDSILGSTATMVLCSASLSVHFVSLTYEKERKKETNMNVFNIGVR